MASGFTGRVMVRASPSSDLVAHRSDVTRYNNLRRRNPVVDEHVRLTLVLKLLGASLAIFVAIALADAVYQRYRWHQRLRMSKEEMKQEHKESEGSPEVKGRMKQIRRAYQLTHEYDKALPFLLLGAFLLPIALGIVFGLTVGYMVNAVLIGVGIGVLLPMMVLVRRAKAATYKR